MYKRNVRALLHSRVIFLSSFALLTFWVLQLRSEETIPETVDGLIGQYRLLSYENLSMEPPPYQTEQLTADDWHQLINLPDFTFTMNDPAAHCNVSYSPVVFAVVHSAPKHFHHRTAIRSTWGRDLGVVFLVGETDSVTQKMLRNENAKYSDIIQGSFMDSYKNLTYKHVMGLKWITYYCRTARYILKLDDDVFVNSRNLQHLIVRHLSPLGARRLVLCRAKNWIVVDRSYRSKWRVTPSEYTGRWYPVYCTGWAVLYSPDAIFALYREAQRTPYFWIDDVHVTGTLLARANLTHTSFSDYQKYLWAEGNSVFTHQNDFVVGLSSYSDFYFLRQRLIRSINLRR